MNQYRPPNAAHLATNSVAACLLAGGRGERLGQRNKGLLPWPAADSSPLVATVLHRLAGQVDAVVISANADIPQYEEYGHTVVPDPPGLVHTGPLAGVLAAGEVAQTDWLLSAAVDCPNLPLDLVVRFLAADADIAVAYDGQRLQPLTMLMSRKLLPELRRYLQGGGRSVYGWLESRDYVTVDFSDQPGAFVNLNTEEDFKDHQ